MYMKRVPGTVVKDTLEPQPPLMPQPTVLSLPPAHAKSPDAAHPVPTHSLVSNEDEHVSTCSVKPASLLEWEE